MKILVSFDQAPGAWPNDATVRKVNSRPGDATPDGTRGLILGSVDMREFKLPARFGYFLEWDNLPGIPVFCADTNDDGSPRLTLNAEGCSNAQH